MKPPRLHFHGAAGGVTGSCFLLEAGGARILIDCGMFQGSKSEKELNYRPFPFEVRGLTAVCLTHAHIDHSGQLPRLVRAGYDGPIHATRATADLCGVMLPDSGHIQEMEVEQLNRRNVRRGRPPVEPIYGADDAVATLPLFRPHGYGDLFTIAQGVRGRFWNAGHLLGSASLEVELDRAGVDGGPLRLVFSGDIGPAHKLLHPEPEAPGAADYVICESTYGDTDRVEIDDDRRRAILKAEIAAAIRPSGALIIPSFAVERTQELLVDLHRLIQAGELPSMPIFIDSPLASRASAIFHDHAAEMEEGLHLRSAMRARNVRFTENVEQSKAIGRMHDFHVIVSASGMCEAGRVRHHLKNRLWRDDTTVLMVGYQAQGTLGRILLDGAPRVRIQGEDIEVRARIRSLDVYSGHADGPELAAWVAARHPAAGVFLVHGEEGPAAALRERLIGTLPAGSAVAIPSLDDAWELGPQRATPAADRPAPRVRPERVGRPDWHNELSRLVLDIDTAMERTADEKGRAVLVRRLRRALDEAGSDAGPESRR